MKKLLAVFLITALTISCLAGCGNNEPAEKETTSEVEKQQTEEPSTETESVGSEAETEVAETEVEETTDEYDEDEETVELQFEPATVIVADVETGTRVEVTYNDCYFSVQDDTPEYVSIVMDNDMYMATFFTETPDMDVHKILYGGCNITYFSDMSVTDFYNSRIGACNVTGTCSVSEMVSYEIKAGTLYNYNEYYTSDNAVYAEYAVLECGNGVLVFETWSDGAVEMELVFDIFFIDAKVAE